MSEKIAVTMGDPAGIGPELIEQVVSRLPEWRSKICVIGVKDWVDGLHSQFGVDVESTDEGATELCPGSPSVEGAVSALDALNRAATGCVEGRYAAVVTGPISKHWCQKAGMTQPGQTEFFADHWKGQPTMAFVASKMVVSLATWHIPLMDVKSALTKDTLARTLDHTADLLKRLGFEHPRIAVCGLNPHAGEQGQIGREEMEIIEPLMEEWQSANTDVILSGCHPADTVFYRHLQGEFDGVVALYHDQALGPVKTVAFHDAVNVSLGLAHVRTSPDHGTAFNIAGQGIAKPESLLRALELADRLSR